MRKEEGAAVDSSAILPYLLAQRAASFVGQDGQFIQRKSKPLGNTHKIPFISDCRRDRDFQTNKTKMQMSLRTD